MEGDLGDLGFLGLPALNIGIHFLDHKTTASSTPLFGTGLLSFFLLAVRPRLGAAAI